jgi:probable F420-dependent oxidoreductase
MKFGLCLPNYGPAASVEGILSVARAAEEAGFDSVWTTDHVLVPAEHGAIYGHLYESLVTLAFLAGTTSRLTLATSILVLPQRDPILVAKQVAAIDRLSNGRVLLGVGVGWMEGEYEFLRTDFRRRGRIMDEWIQVLKTLWGSDNPSFEGEWVSFDNAVFEPRPASPGGPPIHVGGNSETAIRRAATIADGWHPANISPETLAGGIRKLREWSGNRPVSVSLRKDVRMVEGYRDFRSSGGGTGHPWLEGSREAITGVVGAYQEAGLDHFVCYFAHETAEQVVDQLERFAEKVIPAFR